MGSFEVDSPPPPPRHGSRYSGVMHVFLQPCRYHDCTPPLQENVRKQDILKLYPILQNKKFGRTARQISSVFLASRALGKRIFFVPMSKILTWALGAWLIKLKFCSQKYLKNMKITNFKNPENTKNQEISTLENPKRIVRSGGGYGVSKNLTWAKTKKTTLAMRLSETTFRDVL